jgi:osmotically-inducible protein OsmY
MKKLLLILCSTLALQGCAVALVAGAAGGAASYQDRRSTGAQIDDQTIEVKAATSIAQDPALSEHTHINIVSFNRSVLVVGQSPNDMLKDQIINKLRKIDSIKDIHNQIRIGNITSLLTRSNDAWLTSKVKTQLLTDETIPGSSIKVVTENGEVFLMGMVTKDEASRAVEKARHISGVNRVFKAFEYIQ